MAFLEVRDFRFLGHCRCGGPPLVPVSLILVKGHEVLLVSVDLPGVPLPRLHLGEACRCGFLGGPSVPDEPYDFSLV
jgi:hypothetical protein